MVVYCLICIANALCNGLITAGAVEKRSVWLSDANETALGKYSKLGVNTTTDNTEVCKNVDVLILAVKPHIVPIVLKELHTHIKPTHLIISIAAGVPIASIEALLPEKSKIVRVMPNTPSLVGAGAAGYAMGQYGKQADAALVEKIFQCVGVAVKVGENLLDAVTGVSGSGPAYIFILIEALADGGVRAGLPRDVAQTLAAQVVYGSSKMVKETQLHPGVLKDQVCSPGGTTIAAVHALETGNFRNTLINAVMAANNRGKELAAASAQQANKRTEQILNQLNSKKK